ncbi:MAG: helix-turn-helix domain-containing protein [Pseudomonadota bacterium]
MSADGSALERFPRDYPVAKFIDIVGDAWTPIVLHQLANAPVRYGVLRRSLPGVSKKMLTQTLRRLEKARLVIRTVIDTNPIGTLYRLTAEGRALLTALEPLCQWSQDHADLLDTLRDNLSAET